MCEKVKFQSCRKKRLILLSFCLILLDILRNWNIMIFWQKYNYLPFKFIFKNQWVVRLDFLFVFTKYVQKAVISRTSSRSPWFFYYRFYLVFFFNICMLPPRGKNKSNEVLKASTGLFFNISTFSRVVFFSLHSSSCSTSNRDTDNKVKSLQPISTSHHHSPVIYIISSIAIYSYFSSYP